MQWGDHAATDSIVLEFGFELQSLAYTNIIDNMYAQFRFSWVSSEILRKLGSVCHEDISSYHFASLTDLLEI
jgi:hypothetical protein